MHAYVKDVMTTEVIAARPDASYPDLAAVLHEHRISGFPVVDGEGALAGAPGSVILGRNIAGQVRHVEGVVAVRDRFTYPAPAAQSASPAPSDPGL